MKIIQTKKIDRVWPVVLEDNRMYPGSFFTVKFHWRDKDVLMISGTDATRDDWDRLDRAIRKSEPEAKFKR